MIRHVGRGGRPRRSRVLNGTDPRMLLHRRILLLPTVALVGGSIGWTAWEGLRLRSDGYRRAVERDLTDFFEMPCEVGRIRPRTFSSRSFEDVVLWLPEHRGTTPVFT